MEYKAKVTNSMISLTKKQEVQFKNFADMEQLDELTKAGPVLIDLANIVTVSVHNEKSDNQDYNKYVYVDKNGGMYISGSEPLYRQACDIMEDMKGSEEDYAIKVIRKPSANYKDRDFLTCVIV